jgi:hypothetical protein
MDIFTSYKNETFNIKSYVFYVGLYNIFSLIFFSDSHFSLCMDILGSLLVQHDESPVAQIKDVLLHIAQY